MKAEKSKKIAKRSYYLPSKLMKEFALWCKPGKDYSTKVAGAIYLYMQFNANIRELSETLAFEDSISETSKHLRSLLNEEMSNIEGKLLAHDVVSSVIEAQTKDQKRKKIHNSSKSA